MQRRGHRGSRALAAAAGWVALAVQAASIVGVSPQGEVAQVRQVSVKFSEAVVPFGDLRLPDPVTLRCDGGTPAGSARWASDRVWLFDFAKPLPPGVRCTLAARPDWSPQGGTLTGSTQFAFSTGGPAVVRVQPWEGATIEEDQHFLLTLNGPALESTVAAHAACEVEGLGERQPVRVVGGAAREAVLKARRLGAAADRTLLLACQRPLPNGARVRLVWGAGIAAAANPKVVTRTPQRFGFEVRGAFTAEFSCERENAGAPCIPVRPMRLRFSEPVARALAAQVRLKPERGAPIAPVFDADDRAAELQDLRFPVPLAEDARFTIVLPPDVVDAAGRTLSNAKSFPLAVGTGRAPPIAKFAAAPFGILEWAAEPVLPVTLRHVQGDLRPGAAGGQVRIKRLASDADILAWLGRVRHHHETELSARELGLPTKDWYRLETVTDARGRSVVERRERYVPTREVSLLAREADVKRLDLPQLQGGDPRPFEVVGIPLTEPGYHVVEIESARLGASLLASKAPMFVRTGVLVTNLGVHFKHGRENSAVWVTSLDRGRPVANADVAVNDCRGRRLWTGRTDALGLARVPQVLDPANDDCVVEPGLFVTARHADAQGVVDTAFVFSSWHEGIEPWRFNLPISRGAEPTLRAHTVFDRTLLRAGETVSMKHFIRVETSAGLAPLPEGQRPTQLKIVHQGSGEEVTLPLAWAEGGRHALSSWKIPPAARLGAYEVVLAGERRSAAGGSFRVEAFRVPLVDARISGPKDVPVAPRELPIDVQMSYLSGGAMTGAALRGTALLRPRGVDFAGYEDYAFAPPRDPAEAAGTGPGDEDESEADGGAAPADGRLVADRQALVTDGQGGARWLLKDLPPVQRPSELLAELSFADPNGETQTVATTLRLWPSAVVVGLRAQSWVRHQGRLKIGAVVLDTAGRPLAGRAVEVRGRLAQVLSTRKRLVGGFYGYDNRTELKELGTLCRGTSDAAGRVACEAVLDSAGQVELIARASDDAGRAVEAASSVWVTKQGELWFAQDNDDRIDVLPEKKAYEPGVTARLQVRMPFREATALVAVEREGVIDTRVLTLRGDDPTIELRVDPAWGPNVYVSVLALRGRIRETPWYSFFTWGWKEPLSWARSYWYAGREYQAPTAMVDLSRPAFKFGVAALRIGLAPHTLDVSVSTDKPQYGVRQKAMARVRVAQGGQPLAGAQVAFAAVDEGLLALRANDSWALRDGLLQPRGWGVETSTAQGEIVGRRHHGRKAVAAGGGGGRGGTRELFDTLLAWRPVVTLDAKGEALIEVPLNDSLTSFRLVAVADAPGERFGTGQASIRVTQDLQLLPGLPPLVREGDRFDAMLTLRNTTARPMALRATLAGVPRGDAAAAPLAPAPRELTLAAGAAVELSWPIDVPAEAAAIDWTAAVEETGGASGRARDRVAFTQRVAAAVPLRVMQATIVPLDAPFALPVTAPADALPATGAKRGGLNLALQPRLSGALPGVRRYFETYPFSCLEQKGAKAIGLHDAALWAALVNELPTYLDRDGLANYFPVREDDAPRGSDRLTALLVAAAHESGFELPPALRDRMLDGLAAFVEGRIERRFWAPRADLDVRKLAALDALARHGRATPRQLGSIALTPNLWPTAALIDWLNLLQRTPAMPDRARRLDEARQILRARLTWGGTTLKFSTEDDDFWWWLMDSADANAARLVLAVLDDPGFRDELPRLVVGSLQRQKRGAWLTTTANLWGVLALDKFAAKFESVPVSGRTSAEAGPGATLGFDWAAQPEGGSVRLAWPAAPATLNVVHEGAGRPWLTLQSLAAVPLKAPLRAGYTVTRRVEPVEQKRPGVWSRGDVMRVRVEVDAQSDMSWVVVSDPVPGGATVLGSGLGRDSALATRGERREGRAWAAFEERGFEAWRSYFEYLPRGRHVLEYSVRLNNPGRYALPPTRVEAMYAPDSHGESPNLPVEVGP